MPSSILPVSASVALEQTPDVTSYVVQLNEALSRPWTKGEVVKGRWITALVGGSKQEEIFRIFSVQGWAIEVVSTPRNETIWAFKPIATRDI